MKYGVTMRSYKGMYFVEFNSRSLGCTLFASWDKEQAQAEYDRFTGISEQDMIRYLNA